MVREIDINTWITAENGTENIDFSIPTLAEKPIVQVYRYLVPDNNELAEEVNNAQKGVAVEGEFTTIFVKYNERFRGYVVVK
jgi:hypothetical protein